MKMTLETLDPINSPCLKDSEIIDLFHSNPESGRYMLLKSRLELHVVKTHCNRCRRQFIALIDCDLFSPIKQEQPVTTNSGLVFYPSDLMMRCRPCLIMPEEIETNPLANAVRLSDGELQYFDNEQIVYVIYVKVITG